MSDKLIMVCTQCLTRNAVPGIRLSDGPKCGKCSAPLATGMAEKIDEAGLEQMLKNETLPVLVDVWAPWCGPCVVMAPDLESLAAEFRSQCRVLKLDVDENPQMATKLGIRNIPTLVLFKKGTVASRRSGAVNLSSMRQWLTDSFG